jgi:branched-chain amino acid transport system substrate-binding protein
MLKTLLAAVLTLALCAPCGAAPDYPISVILPLTGPSAFVGQLEQESLRVYESVANRTGGIRGVPVRFAFLDDQSSPQVAVQLATQIKENKPAVMIGSSIVAQCAAIAPLVASDGPLQYCLSPGFSPRQNSYSFASSPALEGITQAMVRYLRMRGYERLAVISATDASAQEADRITLKMLALPENSALKSVAYEHFNNGDLTVAAQVGRVKAAAAQAMIVYASGPSFANILRAMKDTGLDIPVVTSTANYIPSLLTQYHDMLPTELLFNGFAYQAGTYLGNGPLRRAATEFTDAYKAAGLTPNPVGALAWDPAKIIVSALRALGPAATAAQVQRYVLDLHGFSGVMGTYDFRRGDQHGIAPSDVVIVKWDTRRGEAAPASRLGGVPL